MYQLAQGLCQVSTVIKSESKSPDSQVCSRYLREPPRSHSWCMEPYRSSDSLFSSCNSAAIHLGLCRSGSRCMYCIVTCWMSLPWSLSHSGALSSNRKYTETEMKKQNWKSHLKQLLSNVSQKISITAATDQYFWIEASFLF